MWSLLVALVDPTSLFSVFFHTQCSGWLTDLSEICELILTLSSLTLHCHLHPLQAPNCCRNSRLVVDEDDLMCVKK